MTRDRAAAAARSRSARRICGSPSAEALEGDASGAIAVVVGAWHVPALRRRRRRGRRSRSCSRALPKIKMTATWVPWTDTRLAAASRLRRRRDLARLVRASVVSSTNGDAAARRAGACSAALAGARRRPAARRRASRPRTASVIEAARLSRRSRRCAIMPMPGLAEMREATLATLCQGETDAVPADRDAARHRRATSARSTTACRRCRSRPTLRAGSGSCGSSPRPLEQRRRARSAQRGGPREVDCCCTGST